MPAQPRQIDVELHMDAPDPTASADASTPLASSAADTIARLLQTKEYNLSIKQRRLRPLLTFSIFSGHTQHTPKPKPIATQSGTKNPSKKTTLQLVVLVVILLLIVLAVDAELLSLGFTLPFDLIKR